MSKLLYTGAKLCLLLLAVFLIVNACNSSAGLDSAYGTLRLRISGPAGTQGFEPDNSEITHLRVYGIGPSDRVVDPDPFPVGAAEIVIPDLLPGTWTFIVDAINSDAVPILTGQAVVFIEAGQLTEVDMILAPDSGEGTLVVEFIWPAQTLDGGQVDAGLARYEQDDFGVAEPLEPFSASQANGIELRRYEGQQPAGYYRLDGAISDDNGNAFSDTTTVRILSSLTTVVIIDLETGDVELVIELQPQLPLAVALAAEPEGPLSVGESVTVTGTVTGGTGTYSYRWYLDGVLLSDESDTVVTVGADLEPGRYRLTLIASDGEVLGSEGIVLDILP